MSFPKNNFPNFVILGYYYHFRYLERRPHKSVESDTSNDALQQMTELMKETDATIDIQEAKRSMIDITYTMNNSDTFSKFFF